MNNQTNIPEGTISFFATSNAPTGWLACDGAYLRKTQYPRLYAAIGTIYGGQLNKFRLPDMRGLFPRAWDGNKGIDVNRNIGSVQGDAIRNIVAKFRSMLFVYYEKYMSGAITHSGDFVSQPCLGHGVDSSAMGYQFDASRVVPTADENRPKNIALLAMIKCDDNPGEPSTGIEVYEGPFVEETNDDDNHYQLMMGRRESSERSLPNMIDLFSLNDLSGFDSAGAILDVKLELNKQGPNYPLANLAVNINAVHYGVTIGITPRPEFLQQEFIAQTAYGNLAAYYNHDTNEFKSVASWYAENLGLNFAGIIEFDRTTQVEFRFNDRRNALFNIQIKRNFDRRLEFKVDVDMLKLLNTSNPSNDQLIFSISGDVERALSNIRNGTWKPTLQVEFIRYF